MTADRLLVTGVAAIRHELARRGLDYCERHVRRLYAEGKLDGAFKAGGRTSPIRMPVAAIDRLARKEG